MFLRSSDRIERVVKKSYVDPFEVLLSGEQREAGDKESDGLGLIPYLRRPCFLFLLPKHIAALCMGKVPLEQIHKIKLWYLTFMEKGSRRVRSVLLKVGRR